MAPIAAYVPAPSLQTALDDFRDYVSRKFKVPIMNYADLHRFSITRLDDFWKTLWDYTGIIASIQPTKAVDECIPIDQFPQFFEDSMMNFTENILSRKQNGIAIINIGEKNLYDPEIYSWQELRQLVRQYADALKVSGAKQGELIALIGSNCVRSLALLLATGAIGAMFTSFATDTGDKALDDRLGLFCPRILFAESTYEYNGKTIDISTKIVNIFTALNCKEKCELVNYKESRFSNNNFRISFDEFLSRDTGADLMYKQVPFNTPFVIMFSSGTTGTPKGIVHSHGGLVLNGVKEHILHHNIGPGDIYFHFTGIGWTLWNIVIGSLFAGSAVILYDGSPFYPTPERFLRAIFANKVTSFGAGPRYYSELQKNDIKPKTFAPYLHTILSTGALLTVPLANWLVEAFGPLCQIGFSGGTELCGSFMHGTRSMPSYPGEISVKALGMDIAVFSPDGIEVPEGESGELVCRKPFPNMPVMFLNDPNRRRYHDTYFTKFPNVWTHGDFIRINPKTRGICVLGRSDGVLNPSGIRFGSSEIYHILSLPKFASSILDACVVGQQRVKHPYSDAAERVVLFIKCAPTITTNSMIPDTVLEKQIRDQITTDLSRRHVPSFIFEVAEIPYNFNGKKLETQIKAILCSGEEALTKIKVTSEERRKLEVFKRFYHIEDCVHRQRDAASKL
ncbi:putative acetyl-CoA synthetase [Xylogone sp. PMI_703]|nr:putative acetyl-CoA synthetase [Xylogone sp. PMI_703]